MGLMSARDTRRAPLFYIPSCTDDDDMATISLLPDVTRCRVKQHLLAEKTMVGKDNAHFRQNATPFQKSGYFAAECYFRPAAGHFSRTRYGPLMIDAQRRPTPHLHFALSRSLSRQGFQHAAELAAIKPTILYFDGDAPPAVATRGLELPIRCPASLASRSARSTRMMIDGHDIRLRRHAMVGTRGHGRVVSPAPMLGWPIDRVLSLFSLETYGRRGPRDIHLMLISSALPCYYFYHDRERRAITRFSTSRQACAPVAHADITTTSRHTSTHAHYSLMIAGWRAGLYASHDSRRQ